MLSPHVGECQRTRRLAVDVGEAVVERKGGGDEHLASVTKHVRIGCERRRTTKGPVRKDRP